MAFLRLGLTILSSSVFFFLQKAEAQDFVFGYAEFMHGSGIDRVADLHVDSEDNLYLTGSFEQDGNIGSMAVKSGEMNVVFIVKYDRNGSMLYTKQISGTGEVGVHALTTDSDLNLYVSGTFQGTCSIGNETLKCDGFRNNFIVKLSPEGNFLWTKQIVTDTRDLKTVLKCDNTNKLIYGGSFYETLLIDKKELKSQGGCDIFLSVFNTDGELQDLKSIQGRNKDILNDIALSSDNKLFIAYTFKDETDLDGKKIMALGGSDLILAEVNLTETAGFISQAKQFGGYYDDFAKKILIRNERVYLLGGFHADMKVGNTELKSNGSLDAFVSCFKLNGKEEWTTSFGGQAEDFPHSIVISEKGYIYVTGNFRGSFMEKDKTIETEDLKNDTYIIKLDEKGNILNLTRFGGDDNDFPVACVMNTDNLMYITGTYKSDFKFGEKESKTKTEDNIFLGEIYDCNNTTLNLGEDIEACGNTFTLIPDMGYKTYSWSNGSTEKELSVSESGYYSLTVTDTYGCKASDEIQVTLHPNPEIDLGEDLTVIKGNTIILKAETGFESYVWNDVPGLVDYPVETSSLCEGSYSFILKVTDSHGCIAEDLILVKLAEPDQKNNQVNIGISAEVLPNPNDGRFKLIIENHDTNKPLTYEIYSPDGKLILKKDLISGQKSFIEEIELKTEAKGSYLLKVNNGKDILNKVIIVSIN